MKIVAGLLFLVVCFFAGAFARDVPGIRGVFLGIAPAIVWFLGIIYDSATSTTARGK